MHKRGYKKRHGWQGLNKREKDLLKEVCDLISNLLNGLVDSIRDFAKAIEEAVKNE